MNYPELKNEVELLRRYMTQKSWTTAQLATDMQTYGWTWESDLLDDWLAGRAKPDTTRKEFIIRYLLNSYYEETLA